MIDVVDARLVKGTWAAASSLRRFSFAAFLQATANCVAIELTTGCAWHRGRLQFSPNIMTVIENISIVHFIIMPALQVHFNIYFTIF